MQSPPMNSLTPMLHLRPVLDPLSSFISGPNNRERKPSARRRITMDRRSLLNLSLITALGLAVPCSALAQTKPLKDQLVGTWTLMSWEQTGKDGTKAQDFSANPKGVSSFDANGHFFVMFARPDFQKIRLLNGPKDTP